MENPHAFIAGRFIFYIPRFACVIHYFIILKKIAKTRCSGFQFPLEAAHLSPVTGNNVFDTLYLAVIME